MDAIARDLLDWSLKECPAPPPHAVKIAMLNSFLQRSGYGIFIETGTYYGETTAEIARTGVQVFTIELSKGLHRAAATNFIGMSNVNACTGTAERFSPNC